MTYILVLCAALGMSAAEEKPSDHPSGNTEGKLKCVFLASPHVEGPFARFPVTMLKSVLQRNIPAELIEVFDFELKAQDIALLDQIEAQVKSSPDDTVLVYYFGPGGPRGDVREIQLGQANVQLSRRALKSELLRRLNPRLFILLTDCATVYQKPTAAASSVSSPPMDIPIGFRRLFFEARGVVDVHGCSPNENGTATVKVADSFIPEPAFTRACVEGLWANLDRADASWKPLLVTVREKTQQLFKASFPDGLPIRDSEGNERRQRSQTPVSQLSGPLAKHKTEQRPGTERKVSSD